MKTIDPITLFLVIWWSVCIVIFIFCRINKMEKEINKYMDDKIQQYIDELKKASH